MAKLLTFDPQPVTVDWVKELASPANGGFWGFTITSTDKFRIDGVIVAALNTVEKGTQTALQFKKMDLETKDVKGTSKYGVRFRNDEASELYGMVLMPGVTVQGAQPFINAWQVTQNAISLGTKSSITWPITYSVLFLTGDISKNGVIFNSDNSFDANLGDTFNFVADSDPQMIWVSNSGVPTDNTITIVLPTGVYSNTYSVGVGMNGLVAASLVANSYQGQTLTFSITPQYKVIEGSYQQGQTVSVGTVTTALPVSFDGFFGVTAHLYKDGTFKLENPSPTPPSQAETWQDYLKRQPSTTNLKEFLEKEFSDSKRK